MKQIFSSKQAEQAQLIKKQEQNDENLRAERARLIQQQIEKMREKAEEVRIAKKQEEARLTIFACKRCSVKYSSNIKLHEHIRDHHAKKSKFAVSNSTTTSSISFHSTVFLFDTSNQVFTFTTSSQSIVVLSSTSSSSSSQSIIVLSNFSSNISSSVSSNRSLLSNSASEFVLKRSESASSTFSQKFATMRSTFFFKSIFKTPSKLYLTIDDLFRMFVEKSKSIDLQQHQKHQFSSRIFDTSKRDLMQMRIIFYFLSISKSTKFEVFTSMYNSIKKSTRVSSSRSSYHSSRSSSSIRFLFSTSLYFSSVC